MTDRGPEHARPLAIDSGDQADSFRACLGGAAKESLGEIAALLRPVVEREDFAYTYQTQATLSH